jgi:ABC-type phosphate transport system permease subunit
MQALARFLTDQQLWIVGLSLFMLMVVVRALAERIRRRRSRAAA